MKKSMLLIFLIILLFVHCDLTDAPEGGSLSLTLEEISCTEAWLTFRSTNLQIPNTITLKQSGQSRLTINITTADTLLYVDSLLPNQSYKFTAVTATNNQQLTTNEVLAQTMDTTSHNFTWQTWTFGEHSSSVLYDVTIIDENNIWAVGEIYMNDSLGQPDPHAYNAVHWDGNAWIVKKITVLFRGNLITPPLEGVFAFSGTDIWFVGSLPIHGDGNNWTMYDLRTTVDPNLSLSKAWGESSDNIYFVGRSGSIAHYNGTSWTKIESGTTVNLTDIYGTPDGKEVWACGWNNSDGHTVLMKIVNSHSEMIYDSFNPNKNLPYNGFISSLWTNGRQYFWLTGSSKGIVKHSYPNNNLAKLENFGIQYFPYRIRGTELNDISTSGDAAMIWHYNGYSWRWYDELLNLDDRVRSMDAKGGITVAVGLHYESILSKGLLIIGRK